MQFPDYWQDSLLQYLAGHNLSVYTVATNSSLYRVVADYFMSSIPSTAQILHVSIVQSISLWQDYRHEIARLAASNTTTDCRMLWHGTHTTQPVELYSSNGLRCNAGNVG